MFGSRRRRGTTTRDGRPDDSRLTEAQIPPVDFLVVGSMKCGTTTLWRALSAHPQVHMPQRELHFFGNHRRYLSVWKDGRIDPDALEEQYGKHYASSRPVLGGKTPNYIISSLTLERIHRFHPNVKVVVMVREPVGRAHSHFRHLRRQVGRERIPQRTVAATLAAHLERNAQELEFARMPDAEISGTNILYRGMYSVQIRRLRHFFPPEQIHVGVLDDLKDDPTAFFGRLFDFLGLVPDRAAVAAADSTGRGAPGSPSGGSPGAAADPLGPDVETYLRDFYADSVRDLETLLGRDLPAWR